MSITIYDFKTIKPKDLKRILNRSVVNYENLIPVVKQKIEQVRLYGDDAILNKYKKRAVPVENLAVDKKEIKEAYQKVDKKFIAALNLVIKNISQVNLIQIKNIKKEKPVKVKNNDILVWRKFIPVESVGIYVPGGNADYPSSLLMCALPAKIAGCKKIIVCCPPDKDGKLPNEVLVAASKLGITEIFKIGGPQAIAAMAYGTKTISKVDKIVGPGNNFVTIAKLLVYPKTAIDMPAGPSENLIIADECANPTFVAADLITDAEHGIDSTGILLTTAKDLAACVQKEIDKQLKTLPTKEIIVKALSSFGAIIVFDSLSEIIEFANLYAPEHLQIMTKNSKKVLDKITNAGSVFIGSWTCKSSGDYATGANHVLPTGQMAKTFGPLSVENFGKLIQCQKVTKNGLKYLKEAIKTFSEVEKLPAHKNSVEIRFKN